MTAHGVEIETLALLHSACTHVGLDPTGVERLRMGENAIYRLRGGVVVRIGRAGQQAVARREVAVARWLEDSGISAVQVIRESGDAAASAQSGATTGC